MTKEEKKYMKKFLRWVESKMEGHTRKAQRYCRKYWDKYGYKIIKKATEQKNCTTLISFEINCNKIKKLTK